MLRIPVRPTPLTPEYRLGQLYQNPQETAYTPQILISDGHNAGSSAIKRIQKK